MYKRQAECAGVEFTVKGSVVKQAGWRAVYGEEKEETTIPGWQDGDTDVYKRQVLSFHLDIVEFLHIVHYSILYRGHFHQVFLPVSYTHL